MLVDDVIITVKAGNGGNGSASLRRNAQTAKGGPDGGNGGNGGNVYFQGSHNVSDLSAFRFKKEIKAQDGGDGGRQKRFGKNADHITVLVPLGTHITHLSSNTVYEITSADTPILLAQGGKGGRGNSEFKTATNQTPRYAEKGFEGEQKQLRLELRLIADIGIVGLPNAGKSSLLKALTNAQPKIAPYSFTTLEPNLGVMEGLVLADIPGLIEGASSGKGLGIQFLKHIEKTQLLLHCIDIATEDLLKAYSVVRNEFTQYNESLAKKPEIILLTKTDLFDKNVVEKKIKILKKKNKNIKTFSIYDTKSIKTLKAYLASYRKHEANSIHPRRIRKA